MSAADDYDRVEFVSGEPLTAHSVTVTGAE